MTDSSELLEKIWLGNVNEKLEVDQDGYDEETVNGLVRTTRQEKSTIVGDAITEQDTAVTDDADYIPKAANAIDFSKETEVAEEEEDTSKTDVYVAKAKSLALSQGTSQQSSRKVDDDYDEDEEDEGEGQPEEKAERKKEQEGEAMEEDKADDQQEQASEDSTKSMEDKAAGPQAPKSQAGVVHGELMHATEASLRKNGLLLLSQMYIGPSIPVRMSKNRKVTHSSNVKMEVMSDEEERFVDEAARRAAAAASLRFRDYHIGLHEPEEEEEKEEEESGEEKKSLDLGEVDASASPSLPQDGVAMAEERVKVEPAQQAQEPAKPSLAAPAFKPLAPLESQMWEDNILWGSSSEEESGREEEEDGDEGVEVDSDDFEDLDGDEDATMLEVPFKANNNNVAKKARESSGVFDDKRGRQVQAEELTVEQRLAEAKKYFIERDELNPTNTVKIGEYNEALEDGSWLFNIIWQDKDRKSAKLDSKYVVKGRRLPRATKASSLSAQRVILAPHTKREHVHACIPPWWTVARCELNSLSLEDLSVRLNISHDQFYQGGSGSKARIKLGRPQVLNAPCTKSAKQKNISNTVKDAHLTNFHRQRLFEGEKIKLITFRPLQTSEKSKEKKMLKGAEEKIQALRKMRDVTCSDSKAMVVEYYEQIPPVVSNVGMAARIRHYFRSRNDAPAPSISQEHLNDGKAVGLDVQQESPFYGDIPEGANSFVSALENNMQRAPIAKHEAHPTDFLVVKNGDKFFLKPIDSLYCAGQCHPFVKVPAPNSKEQATYQKRHLINFIYGRLKGGGILHTHEVFDEFKATSETAIRKQLKDCAQFNREGGEGGHWTLKEGFEIPKDVMEISDTPENVCLFESLQAGQMRLRNLGIKSVQKADEIASSVQEIVKDKSFADSTADNDVKLIPTAAQCVLELVSLAPWNVSNSFVNSSDHRVPLNLAMLVGSRKAREPAVREQLFNPRHDPKDKKFQQDYARRKQIIFQEMLETISQNERESSSDEENEDDKIDEFAPSSTVGVRKSTIARRWRYELDSNSGTGKWKHTLIKNADEVAKIVARHNARAVDMNDDANDERAKADARREKKRLQEQKRRLKKKKEKMGFFENDAHEEEQRPREKAGFIKISKGSYQDYNNAKKKQARDLPDHLQAKCVRGIKRRRQDPLSFLNSIFQNANEAMKSNPKSLPFRSPVDTKTNPNYRKVIKKPIDLNIIRTRIDESLYKSRDEYLADVDLMVENCKTYNVADVSLVTDVLELKKICTSVLHGRKKEIAEAEAMIQISEIFKETTMCLLQIKDFEHFRDPVSGKEYQKEIKRPMDLRKIHNKAEKFNYSSREHFLGDINLIKENCHIFCQDRFPNLPPVADRLAAEAQKLINVHSERLKTLETMVGEWKGYSKVGTPGTSYPGTPALGRSAPASPGPAEEPRSVPDKAEVADFDLEQELDAQMEEEEAPGGDEEMAVDDLDSELHGDMNMLAEGMSCPVESEGF